MKKNKTLLMIIMLAGIMFIFSGCAYYNTDFSIKFDYSYMADKYVDLLIPIDKNDERYTEYNTPNKNMPHIPENSEIVTYDKDNYRSMLMHMKDSTISITKRDSEDVPDYFENYNGIPEKITYRISLPEEWLSSADPYGEDAFLEFCDKYKYYCAAVFDSEGNIISISDRLPMKLLGYYTYGEIEYDPEKNTIRQEYIASEEILLILLLLGLFSAVFAVVSLLLPIVYECKHKERERNCIKYIVISVCMNIPMLMKVLWMMLFSVFGSTSIRFAVSNFFGCFTVINLISYVITTGVFIFFCVINHKLKNPNYVY